MHSLSAASRVAVDGFDWQIQDVHLHSDRPSDTLQAGNDKLVVHISTDSLNLLLTLEGQQGKGRTLTLGVDTLARKLFQDTQTTNVPSERMIAEASNDKMRARAYFRDLNLTEGDRARTYRLTLAQFDLLLTFKK